MNNHRLHHRVSNGLHGLLTTLMVCLLTGCGGDSAPRLEDHLEELEFDRPLESVKEILVNSYRMPCAARHQDSSGANVKPVWVVVSFDLYVIAAEEDEKAVLAGIERHRGLLDDTIHSVCRRSSISMLEDSGWAMIETRILDAIRPLLGEERIRQISFSDSATWEPI